MESRAATLIIRELGRVDYHESLAAMRSFTDTRAPTTADEIWLLEHPPVYTVGVRGRGRQITTPNGIPLIDTDRGGDLTYHGPGQIVAYVLLDLARRKLGIQTLVRVLEQSVIDLLAEHGVSSARRVGAPGVYVAEQKIAALGLRVRRGASYHGLALNVRMDLAPFRAIDPCGYPGLEVTQLADVCDLTDITRAGRALVGQLRLGLGYTADAVDISTAISVESSLPA